MYLVLYKTQAGQQHPYTHPDDHRTGSCHVQSPTHVHELKRLKQNRYYEFLV